MSGPVRIQRKRTKGWKMPENTVYVGRPTKFGNPLYAGFWRDYTDADAVKDYRRWLNQSPQVMSFNNAFGKPPTIERIRAELGGKNLACWCPLDKPCHADVLLELANSTLKDGGRDG